MELVFISFNQLGIQLVSNSIHFHESCHSFESFKECIVQCRIMSWYLSHQVNASKSSVVSPDVQRKVKLRVTLCIQNYFHINYLWVNTMVTSYSNSITLFRVSCRWCGIHHGPPSMRLFLSTPAHHPGNSLRNKTFRSVCLDDRFSHSWHRFTSLTRNLEKSYGILSMM